MQQTKQSTDSIVDKFTDAFNMVVRADEDRLHERNVDGKSWIERDNAAVMLLTDAVTTFGFVELEHYSDCEYVGTEYFDNNSGYGFTAGEHTHYANTDFVQTLANKVFDVDYSEIRSWAKTINTDEYDVGHLENDAPVIFDVPNSEYRVLVAPIVTGN